MVHQQRRRLAQRPALLRPTLGAFFFRDGPVQDPVLTGIECASTSALGILPRVEGSGLKDGFKNLTVDRGTAS